MPLQQALATGTGSYVGATTSSRMETRFAEKIECNRPFVGKGGYLVLPAWILRFVLKEEVGGQYVILANIFDDPNLC